MQIKKGPYTIDIDFYEDWINILRNELIILGYQALQSEDARNISIRYFNVKKRIISEVPRTIQISKEYSDGGYSDVIKTIQQRAEKGDSLTPYLSTRMSDPDYNDSMLNDRGIHHLHLGELVEGESFVERTGPLLFVRITEKDFYILNVLEHGQWSNQLLVKIVHDNWPNSIEGKP